MTSRPDIVADARADAVATSRPEIVAGGRADAVADGPVAKRGITRRRPDELRRLLLDAGARLFAEQGYEATTYRQITSRAGVSDSVLFRHFGSRDRLLVEAVVEPFANFLDDFSRRWSEVAALNADRDHPLRRTFVAELFAQLVDHREPLRALLTVLQSPAGEHLMREVGARLDAVIGGIRDIGEQHDRARGRSTRGVELKARLVVGMVVTAAVLDDWFVPASGGSTAGGGPAADRVAVAGGPAAEGVVADRLTAGLAELALLGRPITVSVAPGPDTGGTPAAGDASLRSSRRRPDAVRESIVTAARELFGDAGYGATSYRAIAESAATSESALFRHFGSKSALVEEAVFEPLVTAYSVCRERWTVPGGALDGRTSYLLVEMYGFFRAHRAQLRLLMGLAHDTAHDALNARIRDWFGRVLLGLAEGVQDGAQVPADTGHAQVSSLAAMALAAATLDDWFLPHEPAGIAQRDVETALVRIAAGVREGSA